MRWLSEGASINSRQMELEDQLFWCKKIFWNLSLSFRNMYFPWKTPSLSQLVWLERKYSKLKCDIKERREIYKCWFKNTNIHVCVCVCEYIFKKFNKYQDVRCHWEYHFPLTALYTTANWSRTCLFLYSAHTHKTVWETVWNQWLHWCKKIEICPFTTAVQEKSCHKVKCIYGQWKLRKKMRYMIFLN